MLSAFPSKELTLFATTGRRQGHCQEAQGDRPHRLPEPVEPLLPLLLEVSSEFLVSAFEF